MAKLLFKLNGVPEDEAEDVRLLLEENKFDYYETTSGLLGLSMAAIWLKQEEQLDEAKTLIEKYQIERQAQAQQRVSEQKESGEHLTFWKAFLSSPIKMTLVFIFVIAVLYFTITPFFPA